MNYMSNKETRLMRYLHEFGGITSMDAIPIYHIWINDKRVFTCMNYRDAYEIYKNEKERFEND